MSNYGSYGGNNYGAQQQGGYGGQQSGGYGQQAGYGQQGGYGQQQSGGYGQQQSAGYGQQQSGGYDEDAGRTGYTAGGQQTAQSGYGAASTGPNILGNTEFLSRVEGVRKDIEGLSGNISQIASLHQRSIGSTETGSNAALENLVSQTQVLNTRIRDQIKFLETDAARSGGNTTKDSQVRNLKNQFKNRLEQYQQEEVQYKKRFQEQIARQYRIVNPQASEEEVREAVNADWGDEGVFQTALKSNRAGAANSALGSVRARHHDIQTIEKTLIGLSQLFQDMSEQVILHEPMVEQMQQQTDNVKTDTEAANVQLTKGIDHARRARRLKWALVIIVLIVALALGLGLGIYFGVVNKPASNNNNNRN